MQRYDKKRTYASKTGNFIRNTQEIRYLRHLYFMFRVIEHQAVGKKINASADTSTDIGKKSVEIAFENFSH